MVQKLTVDALVRSIGVSRDKPLLVFLGAGASISSGMPSAYQCIWNWKRAIFLTNHPGLEKQFEELSLPSVRQRIQAWCDSQKLYPAEGTAEEYSAFIEACLPRADDRRRFFQNWVKAAKPSLGYQLLAELARQRLIGAVWTTNFDSLAMRAATAIGIPVIEVGRDSKERIDRAISTDELLHVAMHGDYRYDRLSNTTTELAAQEAQLRAVLLDSLRSNPVLVCGYSGRDQSVMSVFKEAYSTDSRYAQPIFWTQYSDATPTGDLLALLGADDSRSNTEQYLVPNVTFDDLMRRIALHVSQDAARQRVDEILEAFKETPISQRLPFTLPNLPVTGLIKSNAYPMQPPGELLEFDLKVWPERGKVWAKLSDISDEGGFVAAPFRGKVYALATPLQVKKSFGENISGDIKRVPINNDDLRYEDGTANQLMRRATTIALARRSNLPCDGEGLIWSAQPIETVRFENQSWRMFEAVILQVKNINHSLALVFKPTLRITDTLNVEAPREIGNAIKVSKLGWQHNKPFNEALNGWHNRLLDKVETRLRFPDLETGIAFSISSRPIVAKITDERSNTLRLSTEHGAMATQTGLQISEPKLTFLPLSGRGVAEDTHPIRGLLNNRPFDALLTDSGLVPEIRVAIIAPHSDGGRVSDFLFRLQEHATPPEKEADYLPEFPGFSNAFRCGLVVTRPGNRGFYGIDEPRDNSPASAHELAVRITAAISALKATVNPSVTYIYIPSRWAALKAYEDESGGFDLHDFVKAAAIPQGCDVPPELSSA